MVEGGRIWTSGVELRTPGGVLAREVEELELSRTAPNKMLQARRHINPRENISDQHECQSE